VIVGILISWHMVLMSFHKGRLSMWAFIYFFVSSDKRLNKPTDAKVDMNAPSTKRMKVVFIRHGESEWNAVFNEGSKLTLPFRFLVAMFHEMMMLFEQDSLFIDSPLSEKGVQQGWELMTVLASSPTRTLDDERAALPVKDLDREEIISIIRGDAGKSTMVSSILRRAISTGLIAVSPRFLKEKGDKEKMILMTNLQEISRNVDTLSLTPAQTVPQIPISETAVPHLGDILSNFYRTRLDKKFNDGNKTTSLMAKNRHDKFVKWLGTEQTNCVIVFGHSLWFREFFKSYLPKTSNHIAKSKKIVNCGCVAFDFYADSKNIQRIPEESIKVIHGGFDEGKEKKKNKQV